MQSTHSKVNVPKRIVSRDYRDLPEKIKMFLKNENLSYEKKEYAEIITDDTTHCTKKEFVEIIPRRHQ